MLSNEQVHIVESLAEPVGKLWCELQAQYTKEAIFYVVAPLSSTPLPIYDWVVKHKTDFTAWDKVRFVLMDEQVEGTKPPFQYVAVDDSASYEGFARKHFIKPLNNKIEVVKPELNNLNSFEQSIDLLILALGPDGNYANVMPGTNAEIGWHIAKLSQSFKTLHTKADSQSYANASVRYVVRPTASPASKSCHSNY